MNPRTRALKRLPEAENLETRLTPASAYPMAAWAALRAEMPDGGGRAIVPPAERAAAVARPTGPANGGLRFGGVRTIDPSAAFAAAPRGPAALNGARFLRGAVNPGAANAAPRFRTDILRAAPRAAAVPSPIVATPEAPPVSTTPTIPSPSDATTPVPALPPNVGGGLNALYQSRQDPAQVPPTSLIVDGDSVSVTVSGTGQGDFNTLVDSLRNLGMRITATNSTIWAVSGMLPIDQLPTAAQIPQALSINPNSRPQTF